MRVLFSDESRFSLSSDCRRQLIWRESGSVYRPENIQEKGPISDMQYHGVGRHHDQWSHAPTCGCEWTMTGQRYIDEVLLLMFVFLSLVLSAINLFYGQQRNMSSNTRCSGIV
ncbi:hypothetical protein TNCV_4004711 [Trichonephila clavipes]|nr:hypothetical protein TNCV_4004711 [Trichonephila clavipes]